MKTQIQWLFVSLFLFSVHVNAQKTEKDITDAFFKTFKNNPSEAMRNAFNTNPWMKRNADAVDNLINQFNTLLPLVGNYQGAELIAEKGLGESLKMVSYMVKFDRQPFRFTFIFYKAKDTWQMQNLKYDDELDNELEEAAKHNKQ